jgi:RimJ/RimL family protein N-acetyltransferase
MVRTAAARVIRFYQWADEPSAQSEAVGAGGAFASWGPARDGVPRSAAHLVENIAWFAFDRLGFFASREFEELTVRRDGRLLHRLIVTPRWRRFPFMAEGDLQLGAIWTAPEARRTGLAAMTIREAHRRHAAPGRRFWYLADDGNPASIGLAEACGYRLVGAGVRTRPLGARSLGRFVMQSATAPQSK